jgi:2-octaprenyl-6-methoxyphenol hydroxylase
MPESTPLKLAVIGAGPVGLALALHAARSLPEVQVTLFDARPLERDMSPDPRTLALSLGSVQVLQRLGAWWPERAQPILEVHVSQAPPSGVPFLAPWLGERAADPEVVIRALDEAVPMLGAVLPYGAIVAPLQAAWVAEAERAGGRLVTRFSTPVRALRNQAEGVEIAPEGGDAVGADLAVVAEGGVFGDRPQSTSALGAPWRHDYRQTAWVGTVAFETSEAPRTPGMAFERFTRQGPAALLPLKDGGAALVWCVPQDDDPVLGLTDAQRVAVLNTIFPPAAGRIAEISPLKAFALGLHAERTLTDGRSVRIGNAAQMLHPVAGQGLNLGLRDAVELVRALERGPDVTTTLRRLEWQRAADRWSMILATDFLARSFMWRLPGAGALRGAGLAALQVLGPVKSAVARQMMFGTR